VSAELIRPMYDCRCGERNAVYNAGDMCPTCQANWHKVMWRREGSIDELVRPGHTPLTGGGGWMAKEHH
jgi:hypothetical protein